MVLASTESFEQHKNRQGAERTSLTVSMIIPTKNRPGELLQTLQSIAVQARLPDELIIIDQSAVNIEEEIQRLVGSCPGLTLKYRWMPEVAGVVQARIRGVGEATSDVVFFVDDDITLETE